MVRSHRIQLLLIPLCPLLLFLPLVGVPVTVFAGHVDALFYINIFRAVSEQLALGTPWPRWLMEANAGLGSPVLYVYPPLPYIISSILTAPLGWFGFDSTARFAAGMYLAIVTLGGTTYLWLRGHTPHFPALCGALLATLTPYLFIVIFLHANLAQLWAMAFLPLWLLATERLVYGSRRAISLFALASAGVLLCHPLTLIGFGAVPVLYGIALGRAHLGKTILRLAGASILGATLSALHWFPMLQSFSWMHVSSFVESRFNVIENLSHADMLFALPYIAALAIAWKQLSAEHKDPLMRTRVLFWSLVMVVTLIMMSRLSQPVWEHVPGIRFIQFPASRLHPLILMSGCWLLAIAVFHRPKLVWVVVASVALMAPLALMKVHTIYTSTTTITQEYTHEMHEYKILPISMLALPATTDLDGAGLYEDRKALSMISGGVIREGKGRLKTHKLINGTGLHLDASIASNEATIILRQLYAPVWVATSNGERLELGNTDTTGLITLKLPKGEHSVNIYVQPNRGEIAATMFSLFALWLSIALLVKPRKTKNHAPAAA